MFRTMRRFKQAVSEEECKQILREEKRAAFSVIGDDGYPYTIPVNFYYDEAKHRICIHGAAEGHKADAVRRCDKVCFTVWNQGFKREGRWEWNPTSVVVFGRAGFVEDPAEKEDLVRKLAYKYFPTREEADAETDRGLHRVKIFEIRIEHMTGKRVSEK